MTNNFVPPTLTQTPLETEALAQFSGIEAPEFYYMLIKERTSGQLERFNRLNGGQPGPLTLQTTDVGNAVASSASVAYWSRYPSKTEAAVNSYGKLVAQATLALRGIYLFDLAKADLACQQLAAMNAANA